MGYNHTTAKVKAVNRVHAAMPALHETLTKAFAPFVGCQLFKATGELLKKVENAVPPLNPQRDTMRDLQVFRYRSNYSLAYTIKACESVDDHTCTYYEATVYVGDLQNGVLTKLCPFEPLRADYTVDEVLEKRKALEEAKKAVSEAQGALYPFGEYDN